MEETCKWKRTIRCVQERGSSQGTALEPGSRYLALIASRLRLMRDKPAGIGALFILTVFTELTG